MTENDSTAATTATASDSREGVSPELTLGGSLAAVAAVVVLLLGFGGSWAVAAWAAFTFLVIGAATLLIPDRAR